MEGPLNNARRIYAPPQLARRFCLALVLVLLLLLLFAAMLLVTRAREQWTTEREFQRRALRALHRRGVQLADGAWIWSACCRQRLEAVDRMASVESI